MVSTSGVINSEAWYALPDGTVTIRFYGEDLLEYIGYEEISVNKDATAPLITVNTPSNNDVYYNTLNFDVEITDDNEIVDYYLILYNIFF